MAREMNDSGIAWVGEIPSEWHTEKHKYLFSCGKEIVGTSSKSTQLLSLTTQGVKKKSSDAVGGKLPESFDTYQIVEENNLIMCLFDLDCSAVFSGLSPFCGMISPAYKVLKCSAKILPKFADYWFKFVFDGRKFKSYAKNLRYTLNYDEFSCIPMALPNLEEQLRIAMFLDRKCAEIDSVIADTQRTIEEYKSLKQSIITEAVTKGVRGKRPMKDSGIEWVGEIPEEWECIRNVYLFRENVREPDVDAIPLSLSQVDGLIATDEMKESSLKTSTYEGWKQVRLNDLVLNRFKGHLGVLYSATIEGMVSFHYGVYEPLKNFDSKYFEYLYHSDIYKAILGLKSNGMTVGLQNLSNANFYSVYSVYPPIEEQREIIDFLDAKCKEIERLIAAKLQFIAELDYYKKSIIYEYVTGKKEVPACQ